MMDISQFPWAVFWACASGVPLYASYAPGYNNIFSGRSAENSKISANNFYDFRKPKIRNEIKGPNNLRMPLFNFEHKRTIDEFMPDLN